MCYNKNMPEDSFEELIKRLPPEMAEKQRAARAKREAEMARLNERTANLFQPTDAVHGAYRTPEGTPDPKTVFTIRKWQNPNGDTLYLKHSQTQQEPDLSQDGMIALAQRVRNDEKEFKALNYTEQSRIRREGSAQFGAYLANEALKEQFRRLK